MMSPIRLVFPVLLSAAASLAPASIPLPATPDWTSDDNDYSTGGAFADVDTNGHLDICTSNGNDMSQDENAVYFNRGDSIEQAASWRSSDNGYFGHCYAGDVDNDGLMDLAVAYLGRFGSGELTARIYRNSGSGLGQSPYWKATDRHSSFDCCLGDFDLDGDLDLAITSGDAYRNEDDPARIYRNNDGVFDTLPCWIAEDSTASDAIRFADIDNDGDLELIVGQRRRISVYTNDQGTLETSPSWVAGSGVGWVLRLALGDYDNDGFLDLASASNGQLTDPNNVQVFHNTQGTLDTLASFTMLTNETYTSCVAWGDANGDGYVDLAAGGWWDPLVVFENYGGSLGTSPAWSWSPPNPRDLVCETAAWGDLFNRHLIATYTQHDGDGQRRLFAVPGGPLQFLDSVRVEGSLMPPSSYCLDPLVGWISFGSPPPPGSANVEIYWQRSTHPDLLVTNWDQPSGNFLFLNTFDTTGVGGQPAQPVTLTLSAAPNPFRQTVVIRASRAPAAGSATLEVLDQSGRMVARLKDKGSGSGTSWVWHGRDTEGRSVGPGVYFARASGQATTTKLVRLGGPGR
ncbi:MAG: VCBS repeat-containing protein [candidate division WOR-3 bacterium]|nr:MAG: VCBS repeat-containing protein [candidate division WOR-3 bacterium]